MGLGLYIAAELNSSTLLKKKPDTKKLLSDIGKEIASYLQEKELAILSDQTFDNGALYIRLHPAEEQVEIFAKDDYLICSAKTSSAGPGYHAFLVDLLETVGSNCKLRWDWGNEDKGFSDETGYCRNKNFKELQLQMGSYLKAIANSLVKEDWTNTALSLPTHFRFETSYFAASSMGFWNKDFFENILQSDANEILNFAARFFPWWNQPIDAEFWKNAALVQMWTDIKWRPPLSDGEKRELSCVYQCLSNATKLDVAIKIPKIELEAIKSLLRIIPDSDDYPIPSEGGIGFHRYNMRRQTTGCWSIVIPGYFYQNSEADNSKVAYWYGGRTVYASSFTIEPKDKLPDLSATSDTALDVFRFEKDDRHGVAELTKEQDGENCRWLMHCQMAVPESVSILTIVFEEKNDLGWAKKVFESADYVVN
jgi:hypothetical protein